MHMPYSEIHLDSPESQRRPFWNTRRRYVLNPIPPAYYLFGLGHAYCLAGRYEEAIKWCKKAILVSPDAYLPHLTMTVVYSMAGKDKEARAAAAEVLRTNPKYSLSEHKKRATLVGKEEYFRALRKAGLK